jgi:hypothetical protein
MIIVGGHRKQVDINVAETHRPASHLTTPGREVIAQK